MASVTRDGRTSETCSTAKGADVGSSSAQPDQISVGNSTSLPVISPHFLFHVLSLVLAILL